MEMELLFLFVYAFLQSYFLLVLSSTYNPPVKFFINCGSDSSITLDGRNFTGDTPLPLLFTVPPVSDAVTNPLSTSSPLYNSARIFRQQSSYQFPIMVHGIFCIRLHFYSFNSGQTNLQDAQFHVSASNFSLLSEFSVPTNSPVIKDYFLTINDSDFSIVFTPSNAKSFAFVNAIELFLLPDDFVMDTINFTTTHQNFNGVRSEVLHTIHRVNVGGSQHQDPLWRNWIADDEFLISKTSSKKCDLYNGELGYKYLGAGPYSASDLVYRTCRELNLTSSDSVVSNITWVFEVSKNARNLVRLHFCNIVSNVTDMPIFNLYIDNFTQLIDTADAGDLPHLGAPFYYDFVMDSNDLGSFNISVGSILNSQDNNAYLNGLEIMEFGIKLDLVNSYHHKNSNRFVFIIVGSIGGFLCFLLLGFVVFFNIKRKRKGSVSTTDLLSSYGNSKTSVRSRTPLMSPVPNLNLNLMISLSDILVATDNFNPKLLIGEGGFGKVYRGKLKNGTKVAVKRSDPEHGQGIPEFETEILVLSKIRHRHLVSLVGYCDEFSEMILVYEFMEKGTLKDHIYGSDSNANSNLSWNERLEICIGAARGLHYLHCGADGGIIHRDVKSTNILLDENLVAKVADFGLSTAGPPDPDHFSVGIKGSFGYIDPEYFKTFRFTEKSDVYAFGVVLLEVVCARAAIVNSVESAEEINLAEWGMRWIKKGELEKIIDPMLKGKIKDGSLRKYGEIVEKCLSKNGDDRPRMYDVVWDLEYAMQLEKTGVEKDREPHEDSMTKATSVFSSINLSKLPSIETCVLFDENERNGEEEEDVTETGVFSQLAVDGVQIRMDLNDLNKVWEIKPLNKIGEDDAFKILQRIAKQVQPIMRKRKWKVETLSEFCPSNPSLMGVNIGGGKEIKLRIRRPNNEWDFFPYEQILDTMLHELSHIVYAPHNTDFYNLLDELRKECEELMFKGITGTGQGFDLPGRRLGGISQQRPFSSLRQTTLAAAENRARHGPLGPKRLGGDGNIKAVLSPVQAAAMAAERRLRDDMWCGSKSLEDYADRDKNMGSSSRGPSKTSTSIALTSSTVSNPHQEAIDDLEQCWQCSACTLQNQALALICEACGSHAKKRNNKSKIWACKFCTLNNSIEMERCIACGEWRYSHGPPISTQPPYVGT